MKYADLIKPLGLRTEQAGVVIGNISLFGRMVRAGWIKPVVDRHSCKLYDAQEVERCWKRLQDGDYPDEVNA